jgi:hypothetical protein
MDKVDIPVSLTAATERLASIGELLTATEWTRAAIIAAFVRLNDGPGQPPQRIAKSRHSLSTYDFAELGIVGLQTPDTVRRYVKAWLAVNDGKYPTPGRTVKLPSTSFPPEEANLGSRITESSIAKAIREKPAIAAAAAEALADDLVELPTKTAANLAHGSRQRVARITAGIRGDRAKPSEAETIETLWSAWLLALDRLLSEGAELADRSEQPNIALGVHAAMAKMIYERITERKIDAELRDFFTREGAR